MSKEDSSKFLSSLREVENYKTEEPIQLILIDDKNIPSRSITNSVVSSKIKTSNQKVFVNSTNVNSRGSLLMRNIMFQENQSLKIKDDEEKFYNDQNNSHNKFIETNTHPFIYNRVK